MSLHKKHRRSTSEYLEELKSLGVFGKSEEYEELEKGSLQRRIGNPKKQLQDHESQAMLDWSREVTNREDIPEATPEAKKRFFQKLHSQTEVRKHPKTGERLFLMHRGVHPTMRDFHEQGKLSSWTPKLDTAEAFAGDHVEQINNDTMFDKDGNVDKRDPYNQAGADSIGLTHKSQLKPKVHSAWIPESALHNYVNNAIETDSDKEYSNSSEEEYIIKPHKFTYAKKQKLSAPALVDKNINQRARLQQVYGKDKDFAGKSRAEQEIKQFNKKVPRPEKLAASEKEIVITVFDFDNTELLKTLPTRVNEKHPDSEKPWVAKVHPDGSLVWHANNEQASKIDRQINDPRLINSFLSKVPESHRGTAKALISHVQKHPNRHFIPTAEGGNQQLRARHLLDLMKDGNNVKMSTEDPNRLTIERESHSTQRQYDPIQIHYKNKGIKNEKGTGDVGAGANKSVSELRPTGNPNLGGGDVSIKKNRTQDSASSEKNIGNRIRVDLKKQEDEMPEEPKKSKGAKQEEEKVGEALSNLATDKQTTAGMNSRIYSMPSADKMKRSKMAQKQGQIPSSINIYGAHYPVVRLMDDNKTLLVHTSPYGQDGKTEELIEKIGMQLPEHFPDAHVIEIHHPDYRHSARIMKMRNPNTIADYLKHASENHPDENYRKHAAEAHLHLTNLNKIKKGEFTKPIHAKRTASEGFDYDKNVKGRVDKLHNYLTSLGLTPDVQDDESGRDLGSKSPTSLTINRQGDPHDQQVLHEAGHALLTPPGMGLPEYQNRIGAPGFLGKLKQTQTSSELKPMHGGGMPEQTAQHMEGGIARRAGIEPFRTPKRGKEGTSEELARDHAKQTLSDFDQGYYKFDPFTGEKELQANPNTLINAKSHKDSGLFGKIRRQLVEQRKSRANIPQEDLDDMAASEKDVSKPFGQHPRNWYKDKKSQEKRKIIAEKDRQKTGAKKPLDSAMDKLKLDKSSIASSPVVPEQLEGSLQKPFKSKKQRKISDDKIEKWEGKALKAGVLALGLAHGAHYMDIENKEAAKAPASREVAAVQVDPTQQARDRGYKEATDEAAQIMGRNFVKFNSYKPSHITMKETIKSNPDLMNKYGYALKMSKPALSELVQSHPTMGQEVGEAHYSKLNQEFGGNRDQIDHAWRNGVKATKAKFGMENQ